MANASFPPSRCVHTFVCLHCHQPKEHGCADVTLVTIHAFSQMHGVISQRHILQSMEGDIIVEGPYVCDHCNVQGEQYIVRAHWDIKGPMLLQLPRFTYGEAGQVSTSKWRWEDWNLRVLGGIIHSKGSNPSTGHYRVAYPRQRQGHNGVLIIDDAKTYGSNTAPRDPPPIAIACVSVVFQSCVSF
mmetsp:Transcript_119918/g.208785  ORF Transcript_119918/g.208785 Transcript_119918/m.208785 type:complete len:186 (-) Transcript_119918:95-652(-)